MQSRWEQLYYILLGVCIIGFAGLVHAEPSSSVYQYSASDFDGNGYDDLCVYYPGDGSWSIWYIDNGSLKNQENINFGFSGTVPVPADYDGDGKTDLAIYYAKNGEWVVRNSRGGAVWGMQWGWNEAIPVPADYNGNGQDNVAVYYPGDGSWSISGYDGSSTKIINMGFPGTIPVPGDYNGDGRDDIAIYVPSTGGWYARDVETGAMLNDSNWGWSSARPAPADYNADGKIDLCVYEGGYWYIYFDNGVGRTLNWGGGDCLPVPGKYAAYKGQFHNAQVGVYFPQSGTWALREALLDFVFPWSMTADFGWSQALPPSYK